MVQYYPVTLNLTGKRCLVVGGGAVSERKVLSLVEAGARVLVVAPDLTATLQARAEEGAIEVAISEYDTRFLDGAHLVIAATSNRAANRRVAHEALERGVLVNVVDAPEEGSFLVPSVIRRGPFSLAISTGGNNPMLAARIRSELEARFGAEFGDFVQLLGRMRNVIQAMTPDVTARRSALAALLDAEAEIRSALSGPEPETAERRAHDIVSSVLR